MFRFPTLPRGNQPNSKLHSEEFAERLFLFSVKVVTNLIAYFEDICVFLRFIFPNSCEH